MLPFPKDMFIIPLVFGLLVFLLLLLFQPFEYRYYSLLKVVSDSLLSGLIVLITTFGTRFLTSYLTNNGSKYNRNINNIYIILDIIVFLILSFFINLISGGFADISYQRWFGLSIKYILIFEVLLIPTSFFIHRYFLLDSIFNKKKTSFINHKLSKPSEKRICFTSESRKEELEIFSEDLLMIKSCGNYIEISYVKNEKVCVCLLRNTLTSIHNKIKKHSFIFRCHRSYVINLNMIEKVKGNTKGYQITLKGLSYKIPVSRSKISLFNHSVSVLKKK